MCYLIYGYLIDNENVESVILANVDASNGYLSKMASWCVCIVLWLGVALVAGSAASASQGNGNNDNSVYEQQVSKSRSPRMTVCRAGWREYQGSCYRRVKMTTKVTWHEAQQVCNDNGGHLPTISDAGENSFVFDMYKSSCPTTDIAYLGLHDFVKENQFRWVDDTSSSYVNWKAGEPNNAGTQGEDCGHMWSKFPTKWNDVSCSKKYDSCFLCEDTPSCPHGWAPFAGKCFRQFHHATKVSWYGARAICRAVGTDLVSINCAEDQKFLDDLMTGRGWYYIGFTDTGTEGTFHWSDNSKVSFTNWKPNEPNNAGGEDCTHSIIGQGWNDLKCWTKYIYSFACEM